MHGTNNEPTAASSSRTPPTTFQADLSNLPPALDQLKGIKNWVCWKWQWKNGKWTKPPLKINGQYAHVDKPETWSTYEECVAAHARGGFDGIGFNLLGSDDRAFDVDNCRDPNTGELKPFAKELMDRCGDTYVEATVSGTGIRIIGTGDSQVHTQKKYHLDDGVSVEPYRCIEKGRFITISGKAIKCHNGPLKNIDTVIDEVYATCEAQRNAGSTSGNREQSEPGEVYGELTEKLKEMLNEANPGAGNPCGGYASRSEFFFAFVCGCLREGVSDEKIAAACHDRANFGKAIHEHVKDQPADYMKKQIEKAKEEVATSFELIKGKIKASSQHNIMLAIKKLRAKLSYNVFTDQYVIEMNGTTKIVNDAAVDDLWSAIDKKFHVMFEDALFFKVFKIVARESAFHPVKDHLKKLQWDGKKRVGTWLIDYCEAEDTKFNRAVGKIMLVAAVRRVMSPGCKFDEIVILESPQGTGKSTLLKTLAMREEWFCDDLPTSSDAQPPERDDGGEAA